MSKRIFKAMMAVTLTTLLVCMALFIAILFPYFETQLSDELRNELEYLAPNVERDGLGYLERLGDGQNRLTLIDADGTVLFDSDADPAQMENHADRPEVIQAIAEGAGESSRYSETLTEKPSTAPYCWKTARCFASPARSIPAWRCWQASRLPCCWC